MIQEIARYHIEHNYILNPLKVGEINVLQIGRRFCEPFTGINPHTHRNWFELTVITDGEGTVLTNGDGQHVTSGDIYLSFPYDIHEIRADKNIKLEYDFLSFSCDTGAFNNFFKNITLSHRSTNDRVFNDERVSSLLADAISEFSVKKLFSEEIIHSILVQILTYLARDLNKIQTDNSKVSEAKILCLKIMNYIDTHVYSLTNLSQLTETFNYNYSYLSALFKKTTNKTLSEYFHNRKLEIAKVLILENKYKINEVAEMLKYSSAFTFSKAFKTKYGVSPIHFKKN